MPTQVNSNYNANFQKFVDFASKAYETKSENIVARFTGMPKGDYKGTFASFRRTADMKTANNQVRDLFCKTVADMFGGERNIPDIVRDAMKMEDFGKGKPLTARRIMLVKSAIDIVGGGMFAQPSSVAKATNAGYLPQEMAKLARVATLYRNATGCSEAEAENAALDPSSKARRLYDYGGRFVKNAESFKAGLELMDKFTAWYGNLMEDRENKSCDTLTKLNLNFIVCSDAAKIAVEKFVFEEISANEKLPLNAKNPEDLFGMAKNPAMQFIGRGYATSLSTSLAQMAPEKREIIYAVFNALDKLPTTPDEAARAKRDKIEYGPLVASRIMKNIDAVVALQKSGKLDRAHLVPLIYPDIEVSPSDSNQTIANVYRARLMQDAENMGAIHMLAENSGATLDEATAAIKSGTRLENAPGILSFSGELKDLDGTARGGRRIMIADLSRPTSPTFIENETPAIKDEDSKFVFHFPYGETLEAATGLSTDKEVIDSGNAIADKIAELCGDVHPKQLSNVYYALSQSALSSNLNGGFRSFGISSNEHMAVTFSLSRNNETGAITIKYSEPKGMPIKFNWTTTIDVDGNSTTTPMRIDHGQYETMAMKSTKTIADRMPGKDKAAAEALVKDMLSQCGDDFELKAIVSKSVKEICITAGNKMRTSEQIKSRIDTLRANLEEIRKVAAGDATIEKAGLFFMDGLNGKGLPQGLIGKIIKAAAAANPGEFAKLSATSSPQQIIKAINDLRTGVETIVYEAKAKDALEGGDQMLAIRDFAAMLLLSKFSTEQLQDVNAAFRSETASKLIAVLDGFGQRDFPAGVTVKADMSGWIRSQSESLSQLATQYNFITEVMLGKSGGGIKEFDNPFDKTAFGAKDIFKTVSALAEIDVKADEEKQRRDENVRNGLPTAQANATNAYARAGEGNDDKVKKLIYAALQRCADNADAVNVVANNMDGLLVSSTSELRSIEAVRERAEAVSANFNELKELSKNNPAIYEAGKRMMAAMGGKALPLGIIGRLAAQAANVKIDDIRKLSPRSSALDIHDAVTQLRDNIVQAMDRSGAEAATGGPDEKQACRNFIAALVMDRCGAKALRAMQGAFAGDTGPKMLTLYAGIEKGDLNEGLSQEAAFRLEDRAGSYMTYLISLKESIDLAVDGRPGAGLAPFKGDFNTEEINGGEIFNELLNA